MSNEYFKSKYAKFLLMILIAAFVLSSISGVLFMTNKYNIVNIDGEKVNINEFINVVNNEKQLVYSLNPTEERMEFLNSEEFLYTTLKKVINSRLIDNELKFFRLEKPENLIIKKITKEPYFFTNGKFDIKKFHKLLENFSMTENQYIRDIKDRESIEFLFSSFVNDIIVSEKYLDNIFNSINTYKNITLFRIPKNKLAIKNDVITDEMIKKYYNNNTRQFIIPEQRKIDYIKLENPKEENIQKLEELLLVADSLEEIAKELNIKSKSYGFVDKAILGQKNIEEINNLESAFSFNVNDFSNIEKTGNNVFIFSVTDIKKEHIKTEAESKKEIIAILEKENKENKYKELVTKNIDDYKKSNFNNKILLNSGFSSNNLDIYRNTDGYDKSFINEIIFGKIGATTEIYMDENNLYFAHINSTKTLKNDNKDFISRESIEENTYDSMAESLQATYVEYLGNVKHKVKVNYKLLDLIK